MAGGFRNFPSSPRSDRQHGERICPPSAYARTTDASQGSLSRRFTKDVGMNLLWFFALYTVSVFAAQAQSDPVRRGHDLMLELCSGCHSIGKSGKSPHRAAPPFHTLGRSFDLDKFPRQLERGILAGHPDMPEFKFSSDDANAVRDYLRTIQK